MAAAQRRLRAVPANAKAPASRRRKPQTVAEAAKSGTYRELLVATRDRIALTISNPDCPPRDLASLTRRLQDIAKEIEQIDQRVAQEAEESSGGADEAWDESAI
jgi:hypothetical protein